MQALINITKIRINAHKIIIYQEKKEKNISLHFHLCTVFLATSTNPQISILY